MSRSTYFVRSLLVRCFVALALVSHGCDASTIISGTPGLANQPFPFPLSTLYFNPETGWAFVGAGQAPTAEYASMSISYARSTDVGFTGAMASTTTINGTADQTNPLFGAAIRALSFCEKGILAVSQAQQNSIYLIRYYTAASTTRMFSAGPLPDANSNPSQGIIALDGNPRSAMFALVLLPASGNFGDSGSEVCFGGLVSVPDEPGSTSVHDVLSVELGSRIELSTPALAIGGNLTSIGSGASVHIAESFIPLAEEEAKGLPPRIFTGISAVGGAAATDGVRGVFLNMGVPIAPDAAFEANSIVGGVGASTEVHINHLKTLYTSTQLHYLLVAGGVGTAANTARSVYALPLTFAGTLAKKNSVPQNVYRPNGTFWYRYFPDPAVAPGDLFSPNSASDILQAQVGGTATLPGDIASLFTFKDAVFVTIDSNGTADSGGVFASQALFNAAGSLQGWTNWHRVAGITVPTPAADVNGGSGVIWALMHDAADVLNTVIRTAWGAAGLFVSSLSDLFYDQKPGIQGLTDFPIESVAFDQTVGGRVSLMVATGYERVALIQSGADVAGSFVATGSLEQIYRTTNGSVGTFPAGTDAIVIGGGALQGFGAVVSADIISDGTYSWLVIGGNGGIAVLARPDGSGWPQGALGPNFLNLPSDAQFKVIGTARNVRKVVADGSHLYYLSNREMWRFTASQADIAAARAGVAAGTLLASADSLNAVLAGNLELSDMAVSEPVGLIATSRGLVRVGNGRSIAVDDRDSLNWQQIVLPEGPGPVTRFYVISPTNTQTGWTAGPSGGNIYVLSGDVATSRVRIYRLTIAGNTTTISDTTVQLFEDQFVGDMVPSFFTSRGDYRNYVACDGALLYLTRSGYYPYGAARCFGFVEALMPALRTGVGFAEQGAATLLTSTGVDMGALLLRSAQGSMMAAGSRMYANE
ncbi:MAG: hypothetical protein M1549_03045 [Candidatus Dependentiae bacterium]|nr:hypothetical protein [Candidatus Dependentiae bacterium]